MFRTIMVGAALMVLPLPVQAANGKAWGGQCIVTSLDGSHVNSASCGSDGVSCSGNGRGGVDCTWNGRKGTYSERGLVKNAAPAHKKPTAISQ